MYAAPTSAPAASSSIPAAVPKPKPAKKNWDKLASDLDDDENTNDPNAGGDAALQKLFSSIYGNADEDTKRAMIKSFTESGGTTLSTDWSNVGQGELRTDPSKAGSVEPSAISNSHDSFADPRHRSCPPARGHVRDEDVRQDV
jgi:hypothetical protein